MTLLLRFLPFISQFESQSITNAGENLLFCSNREIKARVSFRKLGGNLQKKAMVVSNLFSLRICFDFEHLYSIWELCCVGNTINCERDTASPYECDKLPCGELFESLVKENMKSFERGSYTVLGKTSRNLYCSWTSVTKEKKRLLIQIQSQMGSPRLAQSVAIWIPEGC